jgi:ketosteroid isomerase-like protein
MSDQNLDVIRRAYDAFGRGDIGALLALVDPDVEWITPGPADLPTAGVRRGRQQVGEFFGALVSTVDIQRFAPQTFAAAGDKVIVVGDETARVKASGGVVENAWVHVFTVRNGAIVAFREYLDTLPMVTELRTAQVRA